MYLRTFTMYVYLGSLTCLQDTTYQDFHFDFKYKNGTKQCLKYPEACKECNMNSRLVKKKISLFSTMDIGNLKKHKFYHCLLFTAK